MHHCFQAADILIPEKVSMRKWACVACDQFSSQGEYWEQVEELVGDAPSTLHLIIPEAWLGSERADGREQRIQAAMDRYLREMLFRTYRRSFVYLERTLPDGKVRRGLVGQVDLEDYDFTPGAHAMIRATEGTVRERIPPRMRLLSRAALEFPHVLMLCDDTENRIMQAAASVAGDTVYDFDLMLDGGHICGKVISGLGVSVVNSAVTDYIEDATARQPKDNRMAFAVGDGNHSLAAAKACWEALKPSLTEQERLAHPARYALVELENLHDPAIIFEPIHRVISHVEPNAFCSFLRQADAGEGYPVTMVSVTGEETIYLDHRQSPLALAILQPMLDAYVERYGGSMDYIHGEQVVRQLSQKEHTLGLILPAIDKFALFAGVLQGGVLPRKTFSMGEAREKRYYLEGKRRK